MIQRKGALKRGSPPKRTAIKRRPRKKRAGDDRKYMAWISTLPCLLCYLPLYRAGIIQECVESGVEFVFAERHSQESRTEVAHVGDRGLGQKCRDRETLPLCGDAHHRLGPESHHVLGKLFWGFHGVSREWALKIFQELYTKLEAIR